MKNFVLLGMMLLSVVAFPQKKELKNAEKLIKKGNYTEAKNLLDAVKLENQKYASRYYYLLGELNFQKAKKGVDTFNSFFEAMRFFDESQKVGNDYKKEIDTQRNEAFSIVSKKATDAYNQQDFKSSSIGFELLYRIIPSDTLQLYNAAILAGQAKDYDRAINLYKQLKEMKYNGSEMIYTAYNKETGKEDEFASKSQRDLMVKGGTHTTPKDKKTESKIGSIVKNMALIYIQQGKVDEAIDALEQARVMFPKDAFLVINEANIYYQLGNIDKFKQLLQEASLLSPDDPDIQYNIGVVNLQQKDYENARKSFEAALNLSSSYVNAALNLSTTYIKEGNDITEQMNSLGNSAADNQKYQKLKVEKDRLFKKSAEVLEEYLKKNSEKNIGLLEQLKNIYASLGDSENFKRVKQLLEQ